MGVNLLCKLNIGIWSCCCVLCKMVVKFFGWFRFFGIIMLLGWSLMLLLLYLIVENVFLLLCILMLVFNNVCSMVGV